VPSGMPTRTELLAQIVQIANGAVPLAILWHVAIAVGIVLLATGWRPSVLRATVLLALPLLSVSAVAWAHGNPVNGTLPLLGALALVGTGVTQRVRLVAPGPRWATFAGAALVALGLVYPHFVVVGAPVEYLLVAPVGLVPCPTLLVAVGLALLGGGVAPGAAAALAGLALFYGVVGVFALGVTLDAALLAGAVALGAAAARRRGSAAGTLRASPRVG
jgi:hypothetical protein